MTAIKATFSDFRIVKGRKVAQLIFELPLEAADHALQALGGVPQPDVSRWVGIAPITDEAATRAPTAPVEKPKTDWGGLSPVKQAGIRCNESAFQVWLVQECGMESTMSESLKDAAARFVRENCQIDSRSELDTNVDAKAAWSKLDADYRYWLRS